MQALRSACESRGVEIVTGGGVRRILVENGAATGVELDIGDVVKAPQIVSTADPRHTLLDLVEPRDLPPGIEGDLTSWRCRGTTAVLHLALEGPLELAGRPDERCEWILVGDDMVTLERAADAVKYGEMSDHPVLEVRVPSISDPTLAPTGHEVVTVHAHLAPHDLRGGWTDAARELLLTRCLDRLASVAPTVRDRITGHELLTPIDLEQRYGLTGGHIHHGEHALDQLFWLRPAASCARYATPLHGLYLGGSGSHPGRRTDLRAGRPCCRGDGRNERLTQAPRQPISALSCGAHVSANSKSSQPSGLANSYDRLAGCDYSPA